MHAEMSSALATALFPKMGYEKAAEIAKKSVATKPSIRELAEEMSGLSKEELDKLLDVRGTSTNEEGYRLMIRLTSSS